jgi:hypothetical protein
MTSRLELNDLFFIYCFTSQLLFPTGTVYISLSTAAAATIFAVTIAAVPLLLLYRCCCSRY